mmetsp:Transcript_14406/g.31534  ORF Transcript_14406/g.31534 Transcript_14406/m.31534 type:complete len:254 (+) Transcript_14406:545-1306(+)
MGTRSCDEGFNDVRGHLRDRLCIACPLGSFRHQGGPLGKGKRHPRGESCGRWLRGLSVAPGANTPREDGGPLSLRRSWPGIRQGGTDDPCGCLLGLPAGRSPCVQECCPGARPGEGDGLRRRRSGHLHCLWRATRRRAFRCGGAWHDHGRRPAICDYDGRFRRCSGCCPCRQMAGHFPLGTADTFRGGLQAGLGALGGHTLLRPRSYRRGLRWRLRARQRGCGPATASGPGGVPPGLVPTCAHGQEPPAELGQ